MTDVIIEAGTLTASREDRVVSSLLLPYGELGRTNLGRFSVARGVFEVPSDPAVLTANLDHKRDEPRARALTLTDSDAGLFASWKVAATPEGDTLLAEIESGARQAISVEVTGVVIRAGKAVAGRIFGAAFVKAGAFPSATLLAADAGELPPEIPADESSESTSKATITVDGVEYTRTTTSTYKTETTPSGKAPEENDDQEADVPNDQLQASAPGAKAPAGGAPLPRKLANSPVGPTGHELYASLAAAAATGQPSMLLAALDQITQADVFDVVHTPQYLGELWNGIAYQPRYAPLINHADLTSAKVIGWRFVAGKSPQVGDYAGGGVEVPTNEVDTEPVEATAARLAGGWNVDRIHRDFPNPEFWAAFFRAANEDYARKVDGKVIAFLKNVANNTTLLVDPDVPGALGISDAAYKIVKGGLQLVNTDKGAPTYAILAPDLYEEFAFTRQDDQLAYINATFKLDASSGFGADSVIGSTSLAAGTALVGIKGTATLHELGGASPLRVSAEDVAKGNLLEALFGYYGLISHDKAANILVQDEA